jgi:hypothetical protein
MLLVPRENKMRAVMNQIKRIHRAMLANVRLMQQGLVCPFNVYLVL